MTNLERVRRVLTAWSAEDKHRGGTGRLPEPMPTDFDAAVVWFAAAVLELREEGETSDAHSIRCQHALSQFINMAKEDKLFVTGGVEDGVPYRGDRIECYRDIYSEAMKMKEDPEAYKKKAFDKMKQVIGRRK